MAHYIHYWAPLRAELAFDGQDSAVMALDNGWFKSLRRNDVVWIVTRNEKTMYLVLRFQVDRIARVTTHPDYAVGNSRFFQMVRAYSTPMAAVPPRAIPFSMRLLRSFRFDTSKENDRVTLSGGRIFDLELAAMRRLKDDTHLVLENLWDESPKQLWNSPDNEKDRGGFFAPPVLRARIEKAAVEHVTNWYVQRGWSVRSREKDGVGYDLECTKGRKRRCVEVKGTSGEKDAFMMTRGELSQARGNPDFLLAVVCSAITKPKLRHLTAEQLFEGYVLEPLSYLVGPAR